MEVEVRYLHMFTRLTGKRKEKVKLEKKETVKDLIERLVEKYGKEFEDNLIDPATGDIMYEVEPGEDRKAVRLLVNGRMIWWMDGMETRLKNGDWVQIWG